jgi:hypothetical protein
MGMSGQNFKQEVNHADDFCIGTAYRICHMGACRSNKLMDKQYRRRTSWDFIAMQEVGIKGASW